jgi:hypothetical protein
MIISMQGNWAVSVKAKNAAYSQRFIVSGAVTGNGTYSGTVGTTVNVTGNQWTIAIQNNPGGGYQLSDTQLKFPQIVGGNYVFEIWSNDAGSDQDFNDLILSCSTPSNINDFLIYGNVSLYSGTCIFNPCRRNFFVIETPFALKEALKNIKLREVLERDYPERIIDLVNPNPPDPAPFKPIVIDIYNEAIQPKTQMIYQRVQDLSKKSEKKSKSKGIDTSLMTTNFNLVNTIQNRISSEYGSSIDRVNLAKIIDGLFLRCNVGPATNTTLTFEEYDRTSAELAGGPYTGEGNRRLLGDTITDMNGNYIFRFSFGMTYPFEDSTDIAPGEDFNIVAFPDVIVKVTGYSPYNVLYESAPYYNIPNIKRIDLCLPEEQIHPSSACFNGSLIGSLGNVFIGGNQNSAASFSNSALSRYGYSNFLEPSGKISVGSSLAGFNIECAPWYGTVDFKGCMYDLAKTVAQNKIKWYTVRIIRAGTANWDFVSQNYKHPRYSKRNLPNYIGDDVGPFYISLHVDGGPALTVPAYKNIQREIFVDGIDWEFSNFDRYMQLNTKLYDVVSGERTPGKFYVRIDCYDSSGNPVPNGTDMIALYIHNNPLNFELTSPAFIDPLIINSGCGLYRLTDAQMNTPVQFSFKANDPEGFIDNYSLSMGRCPAPMIALQVNHPKPPLSDTLSGQTILSQGDGTGNVHNTCSGYTGTLHVFSDAGLINVEIQPAASEGGWIKSGEYFKILSFHLSASKRQTNGYNTGLSSEYKSNTQILMERLNP